MSHPIAPDPNHASDQLPDRLPVRTPGRLAKASLSVIIPTRNETRNIAACLEAVAFADERIVFDSYSDDDTVALAKAAGARVVQRAFDVFSTHKNWALDNIEMAHDWVLLVDADERVTPELRDEIRAIVDNAAGAPAVNGYYIARQNLFAGKWVRHAGMYPDYQLRLLRRGRARYEDRIVHEHMIVAGAVGYLRNPFIHHDYKGVERYFERHNHYTSLEAVEIHRMLTGRARSGADAGARGGGETIAGDLRAKGPQRRRALKNFAYRRLPMRSLVVFVYMYVWKLGFLDGRIGFRYCLIRAFHEYQISLKLIELRDPDSPISTKYRAWLER